MRNNLFLLVILCSSRSCLLALELLVLLQLLLLNAIHFFMCIQIVFASIELFASFYFHSLPFWPHLIVIFLRSTDITETPSNKKTYTSFSFRYELFLLFSLSLFLSFLVGVLSVCVVYAFIWQNDPNWSAWHLIYAHRLFHGKMVHVSKQKPTKCTRPRQKS